MRPLWSSIVIVVVAALAAAGLGLFLPGPVAGACGLTIGAFATIYLNGRRPRSVNAIAPWEPDPSSVGLHLSVFQLRDGTWRPEYVHRVHMLAPAVAVRCLRQAADTIEDDWRQV